MDPVTQGLGFDTYRRIKIQNKETLRTLIEKNRLYVKPCSSKEFWGIMELLHREKRRKGTFWHNRSSILNRYAEHRLYVCELELDEDQRGEFDRTWLMCAGSYGGIIPSFCALDEEGLIEFLWVHEDFRNLGVGSFYVKHFNPKKVYCVLKHATGFWTKNGISIESVVDSPVSHLRS